MRDQDLIKAARDRAENDDDLAAQLADRLEEMRGTLSAIRINHSLASCQLLATLSLAGGAR
tara:strand:+ start:292 stop:474 length:183 start_codon:yes stop_codon:yes gene_type:complete